MTATIDENKLHELLMGVVGDMGAAFSTALVALGDRLGLYKALAEAPATSAVVPSDSVRTSLLAVISRWKRLASSRMPTLFRYCGFTLSAMASPMASWKPSWAPAWKRMGRLVW